MQSPINIGSRATGLGARNYEHTIFRRRITAILTNAVCIDLEKLKIIVSELLVELTATDFQDEEEQCLSAALSALPIGTSLWSQVFLTPDAEVIATGIEANEFDRSRDTQDLIRVIVWASKRYSRLAPLIPTRPTEAFDCTLCLGSGLYGDELSSGQAKCLFCGGLGWAVLPD